MPVSFLSSVQCDNYAKYPTDLPSDIVDSLFFLDDHDLEWISSKRGDFGRLGYALLLTTVGFIEPVVPFVYNALQFCSPG